MKVSLHTDKSTLHGLLIGVCEKTWFQFGKALTGTDMVFEEFMSDGGIGVGDGGCGGGGGGSNFVFVDACVDDNISISSLFEQREPFIKFKSNKI